MAFFQRRGNIHLSRSSALPVRQSGRECPDSPDYDRHGGTRNDRFTSSIGDRQRGDEGP
jgi:hypothetical protein